jgi:ferredoxin
VSPPDPPTAWRVHVDPQLCTGSGMCLGLAPARFTVGPDGRGRAPQEPLAADDPHLPAVRDAAECCPMEAVRLAPVPP